MLPGTPRGVLYSCPPPVGTPRLSGQYRARQLVIRDERQSAPEAQLDVQGPRESIEIRTLVFFDTPVRAG